MNQILEEQGKTGPLGCQPQGRPSSLFWDQLQLLGDMSLALLCILLLFTQPLPGWLFICLLSMMRIVVGPNIGLLALLIGMPMLSLTVLDYRFVRRCHPMTPLTACKSNLKNIATACEMYSTDNVGRYPFRLGQLSTEHLKLASLASMPVCPGADSTASGYQLQSAINPDVFSIYCSGFNHLPKITEANYPLYCNSPGVHER